MTKQPRARTVEGRASSTLGAADHRALKRSVETPVAREIIDEVEIEDDMTDRERRLTERLNAIIRERNQDI